MSTATPEGAPAPEIKICGLATEATLEVALRAGADMVGLNFFAKSPRFVTLDMAARLAQQARGRAAVVALAVDPDDALLEILVETVKPDWLQLHGGESPTRVAVVRERFGLPVMKAIGIRSAEDVAMTAEFAAVADRLLLDAKPPKGAVLPGGNGVTFDWSLLDALDPALSYMLSGGLDAANVAEAVRRTRAHGVDVSSGVESAPGIKDPDRIRAFIAALRGNLDQSRPASGERMTS